MRIKCKNCGYKGATGVYGENPKVLICPECDSSDIDITFKDPIGYQEELGLVFSKLRTRGIGKFEFKFLYDNYGNYGWEIIDGTGNVLIINGRKLDLSGFNSLNQLYEWLKELE